MDKTYQHLQIERKIYDAWEKEGYFKPKGDSKKEPFSILLPPPNANADLHAGHAMFVIEDILIRYKRMLGHPSVWIPGTDHAGFETQFVYEKQLAKQGKSRFNYDRKTLYKDIYNFVVKNSGRIQKQLRRMGFSLDWSRETFMLDDHVVDNVLGTFVKMHKDKLIYRDNFMVNYCPYYGTTFSDLEIKYIDKADPLYYLKYGPFELATVRPETKFGDTAVAVHPNDKRYKKYIGKEIEVEGLLGKFKLKVIGDKLVDSKFGTGVVKVTPAHDPNDFEMGKRHNLEIKQVIGFDGKLTALAGPYAGMKVTPARELIVADLKKKGLLTKVDKKYTHRVAVSYKGDRSIEPMVMPNWFVDAKKLAKPAIKAAAEKKVTFIPARFEKTYYQWMDNIRPWVISRQIAFGIRIPAWYNVTENPDIAVTFVSSSDINNKKVTVSGTIGNLLKNYNLSEIEKGLQQLSAPIDSKYIISIKKPGKNYIQDTDVFDTWFSSGQWPLTTLKYPDGKDFKKFYPTSVLDTMWDIIFFWVARMIMFGIYLTDEVPFKHVYLHSMVTDEKGSKMSKSKGNVVNPMDLVDNYGADALRIALVAGSAPGNPIAISDNKVRGYRNFANKIWNIGRFIKLQTSNSCFSPALHAVDRRTLEAELDKPEDKKILKDLDKLIASSTNNLNSFRFSESALELYDFTWNKLASDYMESIKDRMRDKDEPALATLIYVYTSCLKMLHPFMPFVTEAVWQELFPKKDPLIISPWPKAN